MMRKAIRRKLIELTGCTSGNAAMLVALGAPLLIGGAGLGVDLAQWYMWKRELQFAVDQGAIAGAWAKGQDENGTSYLQRADQEYQVNLSLTEDFASTATVTLEDYDGGTDNSVQVAASASTTLPFTSFFMDGSTTINAVARAIYEPAAVYDPCLLALDPTAPKSMWFHGGPIVDAQCGVGALSDATNAVSIEGAPGDYDLGFVITAGRVDDVQGHTDNARVIEGATTLQDPYDGLTPPDNPTPRTYTCTPTSYSADRTVTVNVEYDYFTGSNRNNLTPTSYPTPKPDASSTNFTAAYELAQIPQNTTTTTTTYTEVAGQGNAKVWERQRVTTITTWANVQVSNASGTQYPGTYTNMNISCDTTLTPGVYVIDGGMLSVTGQHDLSGNGVMFVLKNGAGINIAGGSSVNLTAMSYDQLLAAGVSSDDAKKMLGMLIFEDPDSGGYDGNTLAGNSTSSFNGIVYLPNSGIELLGTQRGVSQCLVVASNTMEIGGTADFTNQCPAGATPLHAATTVHHSVRLVK